MRVPHESKLEAHNLIGDQSALRKNDFLERGLVDYHQFFASAKMSENENCFKNVMATTDVLDPL